MAVYLGQKPNQQYGKSLVELVPKHRITINNPVKTHYTVQGVQSYAPQQIKALKQKQDRLLLGKQGTFTSPKVYLLSDQIIDQQPEIEPKKYKKQAVKKSEKTKEKQKQQKKNKQRPQTANTIKPRTNARNAVSTNNQTIVKLQKKVAERDALRIKLQKMSNKYKEYFKDVDLKQGLKSNKQISQKSQKQIKSDNQQQQIDASKMDQSHQQSQQKQNGDFDKSTLPQSLSQKQTKNSKNKRPATSQNAKNFKKKQIKEQQSQQYEEDNSQYQQQQKQQKSQRNSQRGKSKNNFLSNLGIGLDLVSKSATFTQKLGTAIHQMFK